MDVGINLRELRARGQLAAAARSLGVNEHEAIGILADAWAETQDREISMCTAESFAAAVNLRFDNPAKVFDAMKRAQLIVPVETPEVGLGPTHTWLIKGNEKHVSKLQAFRENAKRAAAAAAAKRDQAGKRFGPSRVQARAKLGTQEHPSSEPKSIQPLEAFGSKSQPLATGILDTGNKDLTSDPDLSPASSTEIDPRSSVSSESQNELALTAPPSAPAVAEKRKRSPEQQERSKANNRLYRELYEAAEGHPPTGIDQAFNGIMAKFSDKHADGAEQILRWVFERCPDKSFRDKGWPLELIVQQAPRLWRELNNPRAAIENIAAPRQQHQRALAASNDLAFEEYQRRKAERLANAHD